MNLSEYLKNCTNYKRRNGAKAQRRVRPLRRCAAEPLRLFSYQH
jgi:hypothetical protein